MIGLMKQLKSAKIDFLTAAWFGWTLRIHVGVTCIKSGILPRLRLVAPQTVFCSGIWLRYWKYWSNDLASVANTFAIRSLGCSVIGFEPGCWAAKRSTRTMEEYQVTRARRWQKFPGGKYLSVTIFKWKKGWKGSAERNLFCPPPQAPAPAPQRQHQHQHEHQHQHRHHDQHQHLLAKMELRDLKTNVLRRRCMVLPLDCVDRQGVNHVVRMSLICYLMTWIFVFCGVHHAKHSRLSLGPHVIQHASKNPRLVSGVSVR